MQTEVLTVIWIAAGVAALFGIVIVLGLRVRAKQMSRNLQLRADDVWTGVPANKWDRDLLLYGVYQDRSATSVEMIVRDSHDREIGRIVFRMAARPGAFVITTEAGSFEADVLPTMSQRIVLHPAASDTEVLCTFSRRWWGSHSYEIRSIGTFESKPRQRLRLAPISDISSDGKPVGVSRHIGGAVNRGVLLILPVSIPLHIRLFILALQ